MDSIDDENAKLEEIHNPWINDDNVYVTGSCHGLLLLEQTPSHKFAVLNPTTNECHLVPPNPAGDTNVHRSGFGYDQVHGCYKLVTRVGPTSRNEHALELMIYDVNNGTWTKSEFHDLDDDVYYSSFGIHLDGAVYWCAEFATRNTKIVRFVFAEQEFEEVEPPPFGETVMYSPNMTVFDGRLCLICEDHSKPDCDYTMEFWLMEAESDERQSCPRRWTNFLSIRDPESLLSYPFGIPTLIPICFSECGNKILFSVNSLQLFWYDLGKNEFVPLKNPTNTHPDYGMVGVTYVV